MNGKDVSEALAWLCRLIDGGRPRGRIPRALLRCAVPAVLGVAACAGAQEQAVEPPDDEVEVVTDEVDGVAELVMDGVDNDGDGLVDCSDPDCASMAACLTAQLKEDVPLYSAPSVPPESMSPVPCVPPSDR
jgi:hypothetical protein